MKSFVKVKWQLSVSLVIIALACACTPKVNETDIKAEIELINELMMTAINNQNIEALMENYTDDVIMLPAHYESIKGIKAVEQMWMDGFEHGMAQLKFITHEAKAIGNIAQEHGIYQYYTSDKQLVDHGKYMVVWKKENNQWKIARDIWNSSMPLPPRATMKDTISMAITTVKPEDIESINKFATEVFLPAFSKHYPEVKATTRIFRILNNNEDEAKLIYFVDPLKKGHVHDVKTILSKHYTEAEVEQYMTEFRSYVIKQDILTAVPMNWE